ncbi:MAG TPA: hypothetical protein VKG79_05530, partial [Bryobacteraceae bacterium]|nr:hypothetical protein [Bryobacteraceae bacterium]
ALRFAGLSPLAFFAEGLMGAVNNAAKGFFGGRPRRFTGVPRASIARLSLSRSEIRNARTCSIFISRHGSTAACGRQAARVLKAIPLQAAGIQNLTADAGVGSFRRMRIQCNQEGSQTQWLKQIEAAAAHTAAMRIHSDLAQN